MTVNIENHAKELCEQIKNGKYKEQQTNNFTNKSYHQLLKITIIILPITLFLTAIYYWYIMSLYLPCEGY